MARLLGMNQVLVLVAAVFTLLSVPSSSLIAPCAPRYISQEKPASTLFVPASSSALFRPMAKTSMTTALDNALLMTRLSATVGTTGDSSSSSSNNKEDDESNEQDVKEHKVSGIRSRLRQMTGFSLTAFRASWRAFTGVSLTAIYVATLTATGAWIRQLTKAVLSLIPPPVRYFLQPFLILYYAPLFILKNLTGPTRQRARKSHEKVMEGWKAAVEKAEDTVSYWPVHVDSSTGKFESDLEDSLKLEDGIAESVDVAMNAAMDEDVPPPTSTTTTSSGTSETS